MDMREVGMLVLQQLDVINSCMIIIDQGSGI